jgi:hypothetical protein
MSELQTLRTRDPEKTNGGFALFADIRFFVRYEGAAANSQG